MSVHFLKEVGLTLTGGQGVDELSEAWKSDPYWVSWGTKLDDTNLVYFLPELWTWTWTWTWKGFIRHIKGTNKDLTSIPIW